MYGCEKKQLMALDIGLLTVGEKKILTVSYSGAGGEIKWLMSLKSLVEEMLINNIDGFAKSPSAVLRSSFVPAAYFYVRLIPKLSQALHQEPFDLPLWRREFMRSSILISKTIKLVKN
jgi:hypothetical protein